MKKAWVGLFVFLLASCGSGLSTSVTPTPSEKPSSVLPSQEPSSVQPSSEAPSVSVAQAHNVLIPGTIEGVTVTADKTSALAGEEVTLTVETLSASKRVKAVKRDGVELAPSSVLGSKSVYTFVMGDADTSVAVEATDLYPVLVANELKGKLALTGLTSTHYEAGEVVSFTPTTYAGYYYKDLAVVNDVATLTEENGVYSFTMPDCLVTISAEVGENLYYVTHDEADPVYSLTLENNYIASYGSTVEFMVNLASADYEVESVVVAGEELTPADGVYSFTMPGYPVEIQVSHKKVYKQLSVVDSERFTAELKTTVEGELVAVTESNVVSNQKVELHVSSKVEDPGVFAVSKVVVKAGASLESLEEVSLSVSRESYGYSLTTAEEYRCYQLELVEKEQTSLSGTFTGVGARNRDDKCITVADGTITLTSQSVEHTVPYEEVDGAYTYNFSEEAWGMTSTYYFKFWLNSESDTILLVNHLTSNSSWGDTENSYIDSTSLLFSSGATVTDTYTLYRYSTSRSDSKQQYYEYTLSDGKVVSCYVDHEQNKVYWGATVEVLSGTDRKTSNAQVAVKDASGETLITIKLDGNKNGNYQFGGKKVS